jgi:hypothetical protein
LRDDYETVMLAVKKDGIALQFASARLRDDYELVILAIKENGNALEFASKNLQNNRNILLEASKSFAVHCHISFTYLNKPYYQRIEKDYPLYVTMENEVSIEENDENEEIYTGDIFANFKD